MKTYKKTHLDDMSPLLHLIGAGEGTQPCPQFKN